LKDLPIRIASIAPSLYIFRDGIHFYVIAPVQSETIYTARMIDLTNQDTLEVAIERSREEPIVLYKHSNRCGVSSAAQERLRELSSPEDPVIYRITVQNEGDLSDRIAERLDIRHETPQVIILDDEQPVFSASHTNVTAEAVRAAVGRQQ
jgi:bacillithiol system protein YtxJ